MDERSANRRLWPNPPTKLAGPEAFEKWRPMLTAPKDDTLILLLLEGGDHPTENKERYRTIGSNGFAMNGEDVWLYSGWCWSHDHWTQGEGAELIGWLPLPTINI
jgi:hypothetical protein